MKKIFTTLVVLLFICGIDSKQVFANDCTNIIDDNRLEDNYEADLEASSTVTKDSLVYLDVSSESSDSVSEVTSKENQEIQNVMVDDTPEISSEFIEKQEMIRTGLVSECVNKAIFERMLVGYIDNSGLTRKQRKALKNANKLAAADWNLALDSIISKANSKNLWIKPYVGYERVKVTSGQKVSNTGWGIYAGGDSQLYELGDGWDSMFSIYGSYNGSHQAFAGSSIYQTGGSLGVDATFFKGNFFDTVTISGGANYGTGKLAHKNNARDQFVLVNSGIANRLGYNFEFKDGKFILQPNFLMGFTYVLNLNEDIYPYAKRDSNLFALEIEPGLKFIGNINNDFQYFLTVSVVANFLMGRNNFRAYQTAMPELSYRPYARYGLGIIKSWGDRFSGFIQAHITNGGRTGIGTQLGCKVSI